MLLPVLILSPVAKPNWCIICMVMSTSALVGLMNRATSSAQSESHNLAVLSQSGGSSPSSVAFQKMNCSVSISIMKSSGERGSPCIRPLLCLIHGPHTPLSLTLEEDEARSKLSQLCHLTENPLCCSKSSKYSHDTESNTLVISIFISRAVVFFL